MSRTNGLCLRLSLLATVAVTGCATSPFYDVAAQFKYRVPVEIGRSEVADGNAIEIQEVWGTRPLIEVGGEYLVRGRYRLKAFKKGVVFLYQIADGWKNSGSDTDLLCVKVREGEGTFTLLHSFPGPGFLHVSLHGVHDDQLERVVNVYFGTGKTVLHAEPAGGSAP